MFLFFSLLAAVLGFAAGQNMSTCGRKGDADETRPFNVTCTDIPISYVEFSWILKLDGRDVRVAECPPSSPSCSVHGNEYRVTKPRSGSSTLTVTQNLRSRIAGTVECKVVDLKQRTLAPRGLPPWYRWPSADSCDIRVVYPARKASNCIIEYHTLDWTVSGSCDVDKMFASDGHYSCKWNLPTEAPGMTNRLQPIHTFMEDGKEYKRATCSFSGVPMPTTDGIHSYSFTMDPGTHALLGGSLETRHPGDPTLRDCPAIITEGDDVMCTCQPSTSSPLALVTWSAGTDVNARLQLQNVSMALNGTSFTCTQFWGGYSRDFQKKIIYTIQVETRRDEVSVLIAEILGVVGAIVFIVVIVAFILVRVTSCNAWYTKPRRGSQQEDSHTYSDLDSLQEENTDRPAGGATGLYNEAFEQEPGPPRAMNANPEPQLPANYIELIEAEISATEEEQDQQSAHYIEMTETQSAASGIEPDQRPAKHVAIVLPLDPASLGTQCENTTCKKMLTATESETGTKCESTDRKELLASNETSPESQCDNTICKEVLALAETSLETQCENTSCKAILAADESLFDSIATQERRDADGYEIPIQNDNSTVCE